jgi:hypothetical protein
MDCPICLEKIHDCGKVTLQCKHEIHLQCYLECLKKEVRRCPMCREEIKENYSYYKFLKSQFDVLIRCLSLNSDFISLLYQ